MWLYVEAEQALDYLALVQNSYLSLAAYSDSLAAASPESAKRKTSQQDVG